MSSTRLVPSKKTRVTAPRLTLGANASLTVSALTCGQEPEVLSFLAVRPIHTVIMSGFIRDNGLMSPLNRGIFWACRNAKGQLEGVALIGHVTLVEARSESVVQAFANVAQEYRQAHLIVGERDRIELFWKYYAGGGQKPRRTCRELLFERHLPVETPETLRSLRPATLEDLDSVMSVQAEMALAESGVNPLEVDPIGFRQRCTWRIEQGRVWVLFEGGRLVFKTDIMADTPEVIYLEGIYVRPECRGNGYGLSCLLRLSRSLLSRTKSLCVLVNVRHREAHNFYRRAGFELRSCYDAIFLQQQKANAKRANGH